MTKLTKGNYEIIKKDCLEWLKTFNQSIKFIHIDASHDFDSVFNTIQLVLPLMVKGGIICGDDFINASQDRIDLKGGVENAVRTSLPTFKNIGNLWFYIH